MNQEEIAMHQICIFISFSLPIKSRKAILNVIVPVVCFDR